MSSWSPRKMACVDESIEHLVADICVVADQKDFSHFVTNTTASTCYWQGIAISTVTTTETRCKIRCSYRLRGLPCWVLVSKVAILVGWILLDSGCPFQI